MKTPRQYRVFDIHFVAQTNAHGARVSIKDTTNNERVLIAYNSIAGSSPDTALEWLLSHGIVCMGVADVAGPPQAHYLLITENMSIRLKDIIKYPRSIQQLMDNWGNTVGLKSPEGNVLSTASTTAVLAVINWEFLDKDTLNDTDKGVKK